MEERHVHFRPASLERSESNPNQRYCRRVNAAFDSGRCRMPKVSETSHSSSLRSHKYQHYYLDDTYENGRINNMPACPGGIALPKSNGASLRPLLVSKGYSQNASGGRQTPTPSWPCPPCPWKCDAKLPSPSSSVASTLQIVDGRTHDPSWASHPSVIPLMSKSKPAPKLSPPKSSVPL